MNGFRNKELKENCKTRVKYNMECKNAINQEDKCKFCKKIDEVFGPALVDNHSPTEKRVPAPEDTNNTPNITCKNVCGNSNMRDLTEQDRWNGRSHKCSVEDPCDNCVKASHSVEEESG